jgi:hypothetical protein
MASASRRIHVNCSPDEAWSLVGDPARLQEWFPMESCRVDGAKRWVTLPTQLTFEEDILLIDNTARRFQYAIVNNFLIREHLSTVEVIDDNDHNQCSIVYTATTDPDVFALIIAGAAGEALDNARHVLEKN